MEKYAAISYLKNFICLEKDRNLRQERKCIIVALNLLERGFTLL